MAVANSSSANAAANCHLSLTETHISNCSQRAISNQMSAADCMIPAIAGKKQSPRDRPWASLRNVVNLRALFGGVALRVFAVEALYAAGGVDQLLLAGEERVAIRAD